MFDIRNRVGPGLLESVYERCLCHELRLRGLEVRTQVAIPLQYQGVGLGSELRLDLLVGGCVVVEVKAAETMLPVYNAQLLTYLKLTGYRLGLLINFNVPVLKDGIRRLIL